MEEKIVDKTADAAINLPPEMESIVKEKGGIHRIITQVPDYSVYEAEAEKFKALSAPVRLQIMHALLVADSCPSILKRITGMSDSKLSYHLDILEKAGYIVHIQKQKWRIYAITLEGRRVIGGIRQDAEIPII